MKNIFVVFVVSSIFLGGCATVPKYSAYENIVFVTERDLEKEFIDLSGRKDAKEKIQKKEFKKIGKILDKGKVTKELKEKIKALAKEKGGDAIIITRTNFVEKEGLLGEIYRFGIEAEVIKYK